MKFAKFIIEGYRAIEKTEVSVSHSLRPIIGVNESGKTTVLQAILAFDKNNDKYQGGNHLKYKNRYDTSDGKTASVSAEIILEKDEEIEKISEELGLTLESDLLKELQNRLKNSERLILTRHFNENRKKYTIDNLTTELSKSENIKLANLLYEMLPYILYFDDFSDRVPEIIRFKIEEDQKSYTAIPINKSTEWHLLIEEMFIRGNSTIKQYLTSGDENDKEGIKSDIEDLINKDILIDWKELSSKNSGKIGEESDDLEIKLEVKNINNILSFEFKIKDKTSENKSSRFFNITERSKGFQWFFNFTTKLKYNHKYIDGVSGAIYLLDEPGSYLHTSAQEELLKKLLNISKLNTILYCTHSQFLLSPKIINVAKIIIAKKEGGKITASPFKESGLSEEQGALAPLYQALHTEVPYINFNREYQAITEGITEYYFLSLLRDFSNKINKKITFIPGGGATQLSNLISFAITFSKEYLVLLDSDKESRDAFNNYKEQFGAEEAERFFKYKMKSAKENVVFEDHFFKKDSYKIKQITGHKNLKSAIIALYYCDDNDKKDVIENLNQKTLDNFSIIIEKLNKMVK